MQQPGPSSINQLGGVYTNGCPLPPLKRQLIIQLAAQGLRSTDISQSLQVSNGCVSKILRRYYRTGSMGPIRFNGGSKTRVLRPLVADRILQLKLQRPAVAAWEIRRQLNEEGGCGARSPPSVSSINRVLRGLQGSMQHNALQGGESAVADPRTPPGTPLGRSKQRSRTVLSQQQCRALEEAFQQGQYPDSSTRSRLAAATQLPDTTIQVWFSNRRAKWRRETRQQMEANTAGSWCHWLLCPPITTPPISAQHLPAAPPNFLEPLGAPPGPMTPLHLCTPSPCSWDDGCYGSSPLPPPWQPMEGPPVTLLAPYPHPTSMSMVGNGGLQLGGPGPCTAGGACMGSR